MEQQVILERDAELAALAAAIAAAEAGHGTLALVEGPAGIGKTTLLRAACRGPGARVLTARGLALEQGFPYGIVRQLLDPVRGEDGLMDGAAALAARVFDWAEAGPVEDDVRYAAMHGLYWLVANLAARQPLVLAVDDAHWADAPSLRWPAWTCPPRRGWPTGCAPPTCWRPARCSSSPIPSCGPPSTSRSRRASAPWPTPKRPGCWNATGPRPNASRCTCCAAMPGADPRVAALLRAAAAASHRTSATRARPRRLPRAARWTRPWPPAADRRGPAARALGIALARERQPRGRAGPAVAACRALGQHDEAAALAAEQLALARKAGRPLTLGIALRVHGDLAEAIGVLEASPARYELALALADHGASLRRSGQRTPRRTALTGPDALTAGERRVAALAADGASNRQIAEHLFVTQATVETHLRHAFRKLNITSRADLPATLNG